MSKKTVRDINLEGKKVIERCDFNVPLLEDGTIRDNTRIVAALPTIQYLLEQNCAIILCSHLGRPKGKVVPEMSLAPVAKELTRLLGKEVKLAKDVIGEDAKKLAEELKPGEIMLLENVRFEPGEETNDPELAKNFASLADVFVNDAFGTAHRAHASTAGIADYIPAVSGFLIEKELKFLGDAINNPKRPFVAILGGKKVSDKIGVIDSLLEKVDTLLIGGAMAYTFFRSMGYTVGNSICEEDKLDLAQNLLKKAEEKGVKLLIPVDNVVADDFSNDANFKVVERGGIPDDMEGLDIGPKTSKLFADAIKGAKTVVWNGPMGCFEMPNFAKGTIAVAQAMADLKDATTIIGGGDSASACNNLGFGDKMTHISTGGGASLEFLEGKELPGVAAANDK